MIPNRAICLLTTGLLIGCIINGCARQASTAPATFPTYKTPFDVPLQASPAGAIPISTAEQSTQQITIDSVQVIQGSGIYVMGTTSLADGECIQTELLADDQPTAWWPLDLCIQVETGLWEILVSLGRRGAPQKLDEEIHYQIHAWWPKAAQETSIFFPFDLGRPPGAD